MASNNSTELDKVEQFKGITGSDDIIAKNMLEACNNNLEMAINMFLEGNSDVGGGSGGGDRLEDVAEIPVQYVGGASAAANSRTSTTMYKERGKQTVSKKGMAPTICDDDEDEVRAPIPQRQEVLVDDRYHAIPLNPRPRKVANSVFNVCRDFQKETEEYEEMLKSRKNPQEKARKRKRLHELFQPPADLIHYGDFQSARDVCNSRKKWLLVNIQNSVEFGCQVLNRDVWSNAIVRDIVNANFILWQVGHDSDDGLHYATFYKVKKYPHISVIDPRTGEQMTVWESFGTKPTAEQFAELCTFFLSEHTGLNDSFGPNDNSKEVDKKSVIDLCEEDQLEKAILASQETIGDNTKKKSVEEIEEDVDEDVEPNGNVESLNGNLREKGKLLGVDKCSTGKEATEDSSDSSTTCKSDSLTKTSANCKEKNDDGCTRTSDSKDSNTVKDYSELPGEKATILLRLPDNGRKQILFPLECTLQELSSELSRLGWSCTKYEVIKAFPRQNISQLDQLLTLRAAGLHKQETLFIQDR